MSFQQTGKLIEIGSTEQVSETFKKRNAVIEFQDGNYTKQLAFQMMQAKCDLLNNFFKGQDVTVHFNLESKLSNGRWFTNANGWKIEGSSATSSNNYTPAPKEPDSLPF